jgi:hypothetical protein
MSRRRRDEFTIKLALFETDDRIDDSFTVNAVGVEVKSEWERGVYLDAREKVKTEKPPSFHAFRRDFNHWFEAYETVIAASTESREARRLGDRKVRMPPRYSYALGSDTAHRFLGDAVRDAVRARHFGTIWVTMKHLEIWHRISHLDGAERPWWVLATATPTCITEHVDVAAVHDKEDRDTVVIEIEMANTDDANDKSTLATVADDIVKCEAVSLKRARSYDGDDCDEIVAPDTRTRLSHVVPGPTKRYWVTAQSVTGFYIEDVPDRIVEYDIALLTPREVFIYESDFTKCVDVARGFRKVILGLVCTPLCVTESQLLKELKGSQPGRSINVEELTKTESMVFRTECAFQGGLPVIHACTVDTYEHANIEGMSYDDVVDLVELLGVDDRGDGDDQPVAHLPCMIDESSASFILDSIQLAQVIYAVKNYKPVAFYKSDGD